MKKIFTLLMALAFLASSSTSNGQAFEKSTKLLSINIGGAYMWHFGGLYTGYLGAYTPITGQLSVDGEFGVHKYIGVGFHTGIGGRASGGFGLGSYGYLSEFNIPIGVTGNFHFYQLIADNASGGSKMHADKLDIYAGLNVGSGIAIFPADDTYLNETRFSALFFVGPQVGVRYFFNDKLAVNGELGYGKTFINAGISLKLGGGKKGK